MKVPLSERYFTQSVSTEMELAIVKSDIFDQLYCSDDIHNTKVKVYKSTRLVLTTFFIISTGKKTH